MSVLTIYGVVVLTFMMAMYALEDRNRNFIAAFALGCALSSSYGFLSGAWPFGAVEGIWCLVAFRSQWKRTVAGRRLVSVILPDGRQAENRVPFADL
ncbi:MAG: hypothetical protein ABSA93_00920 [Streptosporangiaceae bacterium]|jgi:hypothetical protein